MADHRQARDHRHPRTAGPGAGDASRSCMAVRRPRVGRRVVMGFQADGVCLMHQGEAETVQAPEFPPLAKLHRRLPRARRHAPRLLAVHQEPRHRRRAHPRHRDRRRRALRGRGDLGHQHPRLLDPEGDSPDDHHDDPPQRHGPRGARQRQGRRRARQRLPRPAARGQEGHGPHPGRPGHRDLVERPRHQERHRAPGRRRSATSSSGSLPGEGYERVFVERGRSSAADRDDDQESRR